MSLLLQYGPLGGEKGEPLTTQDYDRYFRTAGYKGILETMVIEPFERAILKTADGTEREFHFTDFYVSVAAKDENRTEWKVILEKLNTYLGIAKDHTQRQKLPGVSYQEEIGYCIRNDFLVGHLGQLINEHSSHNNNGFKVEWPQKIKYDNVRQFTLDTTPNRYHSTEEFAARAALQARKFLKGLDEEVSKAYREINQQWHAAQTGYNRNNIPSKESNPVQLIHNAPGIIMVQLVRVETPQYKEVIQELKTGLEQSVGHFKPIDPKIRQKQVSGGIMLNISDLLQYLDQKLTVSIRVTGRYEITPSL